jgi:OmpA family protein
MRAIHMVMAALALTIPLTGVAQSGSVTGGVTAQDTTQPVPKKKGGLFGKMKGLTKSKLVNTVAKAALCTAVPGGSMIAGAIDAKKNKNVAGAAAGAAGLASGSSGSCMPGMGLGMGSKAGAAAGLSGVSGAAAGLAGVPGAGIPGLPTTGMPTAGLSAAQLKAMQQMQGAPGAVTVAAPGAATSPEQLKQMEEQYRKMGMKPAQIKAMQQQMLAMQQMQQMMAQMPATGGAAQPENPSVEPSTPVVTPNPSVPIPGAPAITTEKGGLVVRQLPWMPGSDAIRPGSEPMFGLAMRDLASAIQGTGKSYKIEARVEEQGKKAQNRLLSHQRGAAVVAGLVAEGVPASRLLVSDAGADKDARIVVHSK